MRWNEARGQLVIVSNHASPRINSYVKNFAVTTSEEQLQELFLRFGAIKNISVKPDRGFAFVDFQDPDSVQQVLTATPETFLVDGKRLVVEERQSRGERVRPSFCLSSIETQSVCPHVLDRAALCHVV
jgi:RNA recognition motif-containing protein